MKELFQLAIKLDFNGLFFKPTENGLIKFFRYAFVGGIAFVVDYMFFVIVSLILPDTKLSVVLATTAGFVMGLITNFILSKKFVFTEEAVVKSTTAEFTAYTIIGVIGYFLNILLMMLFIKIINKYAAKIIVSAIVLIYNYLARKILLYR